MAIRYRISGQSLLSLRARQKDLSSYIECRGQLETSGSGTKTKMHGGGALKLELSGFT